MRREIRRLCNRLGRVIRDGQRKGGAVTGAFKAKLDIAQRLHAQQRDSENKLCALHAPKVEAWPRAGPGRRTSSARRCRWPSRPRRGWWWAYDPWHGNPCDGHLVDSQLEQVETLNGEAPEITLADRSYRGMEPASGARLLINHTRRLPKRLRKLLNRRQVVEPIIGPIEADGLLGKNWLKGAEGDVLHALLCGAGRNLKMILRHLWVLYCAALGAIATVASLLWQLLTPSWPLGVYATRTIASPRS